MVCGPRLRDTARAAAALLVVVEDTLGDREGAAGLQSSIFVHAVLPPPPPQWRVRPSAASVWIDLAQKEDGE